MPRRKPRPAVEVRGSKGPLRPCGETEETEAEAEAGYPELRFLARSVWFRNKLWAWQPTCPSWVTSIDGIGTSEVITAKKGGLDFKLKLNGGCLAGQG